MPQSIGSNYVRYQLFQQGLFIGTERSHVHGPYEAQKVARMHAVPQRQAGGVAHTQTGQKFRVDGGLRDGVLGYVLVIQPQTTLGRTLNERQANIRRRVVLFVGLYLHMCGLGRVLRNGYRPDRCAFNLQLMKAGRLQLLAQALKRLRPLPRVQNAFIESRHKQIDVGVRWHLSSER